LKLLLDTHTFLWFVLGDSQLSSTAKTLILDPANEKWISPTCYWEVAIKQSVGE
jgi:PIN domain nuclease of toxin-antitoxin system